MARRSKLTPEVKARVIQAIQTGATYEICAQYAGISPATLYNWMKQGRERKQKDKVEFLEDIKRAESRGAIANLGLIQRAAQDGDWKASAWILERRHGYSKNSIPQKQQSEAEAESYENMTTKKILVTQMNQTVKAANEALNSGSYQAFAALQRQVVNVALQIKNLDAADMGTEFDTQSDEEILDQISSIILSLPPVLRQRLSQDIVTLSNVKLSATITEA